MAVGAYTAHKQVDSAIAADFFLETGAFGLKVGGIPVEYIHILAGDVDMAEKIVPHKAVIAFRMLLGQPAIFIHIERHNVAERNLSLIIQLYKLTVHA